MSDYAIDGTKIHFHPLRVAMWQQATSWNVAKSVYPLYVEITPCGACNHRCTFCAVDYIGYKAIMIKQHIIVNRLEEMARLGVKSVMFAGEGEPLLHTHINSIVTSAVYSGLDVAFTTNGVLLDKLYTLKDCKWVKVSLNAGTKETYAKVHRTKEKDFDTVMANIADAAGRKGSCTLGVQSVLLPENRLEMFLLANRVKDAGADYLVIKPYSQHKYSITHQYEGVQYSDDRGLAEALATLNDDHFQVIFRHEAMKQEGEPLHYEKCSATPFFWAYVMATGDVYGCSAYLLDDRFLYGNLNDNTFQEIWEGEKRRASYEYVKNGLDIHECRKNCRMDKANRYLNDLRVGVPHKNFI